MSANSNSSSGGVSFLGLLTIVFVYLKLTGSISWSWWWVLSPLWGGFAFAAIFIVIFFMVFGNNIKRRNKNNGR